MRGILKTFDSNRLLATRVANDRDIAAAAVATNASKKPAPAPAPASQGSRREMYRRSLSLNIGGYSSFRKSKGSEVPPSSVETTAKDAKIKALDDELRLVKCQRRQERVMAHIEIEQLRKEKATAERRVAKFNADLEDKFAIEEYASFIQQIAPVTAVGASYLSKIQAQLCKSLHNQSVLEGQIELMKQECSKMVESIKDQLAGVLQERNIVEQDLTTKLQHVHAEKRDQTMLYEARLSSRIETVKDLVDCSLMSFSSPNKASEERRDGPPCDVDTGNILSVDAKIAGLVRRLEKERLQRETVEDNLRRKLEDMSAEISALQGKLQAQQEETCSLNEELERKRNQEIRRELKRTHRRHASHSIVTTNASSAFRSSSDSARSLLLSHSRASSDSAIGRSATW